jgi:hypothetical protein
MNDIDVMKKYWFFKPDPDLQNNLMAFGFECDDGWLPLIDELCSKISTLIKEKYPKVKRHFEVVQVKEKFAGLRFYYYGGNEEIDNLVSEYEELSLKTCEVCGKPDAKVREKHMWLKTLCDEDWEKWSNL